MKVTQGPKGILQIDDARIVYRNFSGEESQFNRKGDMNFSLVIEDQETADVLIEDGWNVKIKAPRDEGDAPFMHLPVKVKFSDYGPNVYLQSGNNRVKLDEETISIIDKVRIANVGLDIRPYDWEINGRAGRTAYLHAMCVEQIPEFDRFHPDNYEISNG